MKEVLFIYAAKSGWIHGALDTAHKLLSPSTYKCDLCRLTHGAFGERSEWRRFVEELDVPVRFLHEDDEEVADPEFARVIESAGGLPMVIVVQDDGRREPLIRSESLQSINDVAGLIEQIGRSTTS